jgi:hypothetical protein
VLHRVWDPIGVRGIAGVEDDEYASYVSGIVRAIEGGAGLGQLADHLIALAAGEMGLCSDRDRAERAAVALLGPPGTSGPKGA